MIIAILLDRMGGYHLEEALHGLREALDVGALAAADRLVQARADGRDL